MNIRKAMKNSIKFSAREVWTENSCRLQYVLRSNLLILVPTIRRAIFVVKDDILLVVCDGFILCLHAYSSASASNSSKRDENDGILSIVQCMFIPPLALSQKNKQVSDWLGVHRRLVQSWTFYIFTFYFS